MQFNNGLYTWNNKRAGLHQITSCLDKFLLSNNVTILEETYQLQFCRSHGQITGESLSNGLILALPPEGHFVLRLFGCHIQILET